MHILLLLTFFIYTCNAIIFHSYHRDSSSARERKEILQRTERHIMRSIPELLDLASGPIAEWEPELRNGFLVAFRPEHVPAWRRQMRDILALSTRTDLVVNIIPADSDQIVWGDDISGVTHMLFTDNYSKQMIMVPKPGHLKGMNYAMTGKSQPLSRLPCFFDPPSFFEKEKSPLCTKKSFGYSQAFWGEITRLMMMI